MKITIEKINNIVSNKMKELKVVGKVSYSEYKEYLKDKTTEEIKTIYIELQIKHIRIEKMNSLLWLTASISSLIYLTSFWYKAINNIGVIEEQLNVKGMLGIINIICLFILTMIFMVIFLLINLELNCKRKILIIENILAYKKELNDENS